MGSRPLTPMRLSGKTAIVTGAGSGIGKATALRFSEEGAAVAVVDRDRSGGLETVSEIEAVSGRAYFIEADISLESDAEKIAAETVSVFGSIDVLVNNAASFIFKGVEATPQEWQQSLGTNVVGTSLVTRFAVDRMKTTGGGSIVNVSSQSALFAQPGFLTYSASKAAIIHMSRLLALDLAPFNIRVNTVCPGTILTAASYRHMQQAGITPEEFEIQEGGHNIIRRLGRPREVANAILFLASDEASFITAACLLVDGGRTALA